MHPKKLIFITAIAFLALTVYAGYAGATTILSSVTYTLDWNNGNNNTDAGGSPYGTVTVELTQAGADNVGMATIIFSNPTQYTTNHGSTNYGYFAAAGTGLVAVNANGGSATVSNIGVTGGDGGVLGDISGTINAHIDSLSNPFTNVLVDSESDSTWTSNAGGHVNNIEGFSTVSFTLTNTSTTDWATANEVLAYNSTSTSYRHFIAAQLLVNADWVTEYVDSNPSDPLTPTVPEPSTLLLIGSGLVGIAAYRKRSKKA